jgi:hypothetical protein
MSKRKLKETQFEFEIDDGYLAISPCRKCPEKSNLPGCSEKCETLMKLQNLLAGRVSCSNTLSDLEEFSVSRYHEGYLE